MSPIAVSKYIFTSAIFVISLFLALRLLFAHKLRRETWRHALKRYFYISEGRFKVCTILIGLLLLILALFVAYTQIDKLITA